MELTRNWGSLQIKSIDPYADVASDVTSRLTKIMGADNVYVNGFDLIKYESDVDTNCIAVTLGPGIAIVSNIVIEITNTTVSKLTSFPIPNIDNYVLVLEYIYAKTTPPPIAVIKGVKLDEIDSKIHLPLYNFRLNGWNTLVNNTILTTWINSNKDNFKDERHKTGYLPRSGGTVYGKLYSNTIAPTDPLEVANKQYVEKVISDALGGISGIGLLKNIVTKSGAEMTGPLTMKGNPPPLTDNQLITRGYVSEKFLSRLGGVMDGAIILKRNPTQPFEAATKEYVDKGVQHAIANMHLSMKHGDLTELDKDQHQQYILVNGSRGFTDPVDGVDPITSKNLTTRSYVDSIAETLDNKINGVISGGGGGGGVKEHNKLLGLGNDDHLQYIPVNATRSFTEPIGGVAPTQNEHLTTKKYVDDKFTNTPISHNSLQNLTNDDHKHYALVSGERAFTGPITIPLPIAQQHAVNVAYMSTYVSEQIAAAIGGGGGGGGGGSTLPPGVNYILSDGTVSFIGSINGVPGSDVNSLTTLGQIQNLFHDTFSDHSKLKGRDAKDAHPQYLLLEGGQQMTGPLGVADPIGDEHAVPYKMVKELNTKVTEATALVEANKENLEKLPALKAKVDEHDTVITGIDDKITQKFTNLINNDIQPLLTNMAKLNENNIFSGDNTFSTVFIKVDEIHSFNIDKIKDIEDRNLDNVVQSPTTNNSYGYKNHTATGAYNSQSGRQPTPYSDSTFNIDADLYGLGYISNDCVAEINDMKTATVSTPSPKQSYAYDWTIKNLGTSLQIRRSVFDRSGASGQHTSITNNHPDTVLSINGINNNMTNIISPLVLRHSAKRNNVFSNIVGTVPCAYYDVIPGVKNLEDYGDVNAITSEITKFAPIGSIFYQYNKTTQEITHAYIKIKAGKDTDSGFVSSNFKQLF